MVVVGVPHEGAGQEVLGTSIQALSALLYAGDGLIAFSKSAHVQGEFEALMGLFEHVGLQTNEVKTVSMACWICRTPHAWSMVAYNQRVTDIGISYK